MKSLDGVPAPPMYTLLKGSLRFENHPNITHFGSNEFPSRLGRAETKLAKKLIWAIKLRVLAYEVGFCHRNDLNWVRFFKFQASQSS